MFLKIHPLNTSQASVLLPMQNSTYYIKLTEIWSIPVIAWTAFDTDAIKCAIANAFAVVAYPSNFSQKAVL